MQELISAIQAVRDLLSKGAFSNEDQVSKGVVMRLLQQLGWDVFNPDQVSSEFRIATKKVDYALRHEPFGPVVLIEVKDVGKATAKGEDQLFDYCSKQGVPLAVLTDGRTWNFYLPAGMGSYEQRRFAVVNLVEDDAECSRVLQRYLGFEAVVSGQSHRDAQSDYQIYRQQIVARQQFSPVWESLVAGADPRVVKLFADEVERRCGIRPDDGDIRNFVRKQLPETSVREPKPRLRKSPAQSESPPAQKAGQTRRAKDRSETVRPPQDTQGEPSFTFFGEEVSCKNDKEVLVGGLRTLGERDPGLYDRLAPHIAGRLRSFLSRGPSQIYPEHSTKSVLRSVDKLPGGWWLGTHSSTRRKNEQLKKAREVAGLADSQFSWQMKGKTSGLR